MSEKKTAIGKYGEKLALEFLLNLGFKLCHRNYLITNPNTGKKFGEIDLVMKDKDEYVFVEVRTRHQNDTETPLESIDWKKRRQIEYCANIYIQNENLQNSYMRFDCVGITIDNANKPQIEHIKNAFLCGE